MHAKQHVATMAATVVLVAVTVMGGATSALGAPVGSAVSVKDACVGAGQLPFPTGGGAVAATSQHDQATAQYKATHDTGQSGLPTAVGGLGDEKSAMIAAGRGPKPGRSCVKASGNSRVTPNTSGPGYAYLDSLTQYAQTRSYYCGPATVAEMSATVPGPSPVGLNQDSAAGYMGTTTDGTSTTQMVNGLNNYVGVPDFGFAYYAYVPMDYSPTSSQRSTFLSNLQFDVQHLSPVAGDAWEVPGGPHLPGHPVNQEIFHWFEIGGWSTNSSQVLFADSATSVWSGVSAFSVYDTNTLETILGGRGYIW